MNINEQNKLKEIKNRIGHKLGDDQWEDKIEALDELYSIIENAQEIRDLIDAPRAMRAIEFAQNLVHKIISSK